MTPRLLLLLPSTTYRADAFMQAASRLGIDLTVGSDHTSVFAPSQPDLLLRLDFANPARAAEQAAAAATARPFHAVFGVDDDTAVVAAHVAAHLGLPHSSVDACFAARDKYWQRVLLFRGGVAVPRFSLLRFDDDLAARAREQPFPCVLKPTHLSMSRGVMRADDPAAFVVAAARLRRIAQAERDVAGCGGRDSFLAEQFVPGPEVAVEGLLDDGRLDVLAIFDKPDPLDGPFFEETIYVTPSRLPSEAQAGVTACVEAAARAIGLTRGPVHAEVRWHEGRAWLIELAARPIGGRCSNVLRFGPDGRALEEILLAHALGLPALERRRSDGAAGVMMIPTPRGGVLRSVEGVDAARRVPHIEGVDITVAPGQTLVPLPEGSRYLGFIYARAAEPEPAVAALREAHALLSAVIA